METNKTEVTNEQIMEQLNTLIEAQSILISHITLYNDIILSVKDKLVEAGVNSEVFETIEECKDASIAMSNIIERNMREHNKQYREYAEKQEAKEKELEKMFANVKDIMDLIFNN